MTDTKLKIIRLFQQLNSEEMESIMEPLTRIIELQRQAEGLASPRQIRFLESRGFRHVERWSFEDAKAMTDRIAANSWRVPPGIIPREYKPERVRAAV